jgi:sulfur carrier protein ThiS adenylyltransferase
VAEASNIEIRVNEQRIQLNAPTTLRTIHSKIKPEADVTILNGFPVALDASVVDGDEIVLIRRGEVPTPDELERLLVARHGPGVHEKVKGSTIGIAGCGGLGSNVAIALARSGVGKLILVDFDVVEPSNLNRQQYFVDQIGQKKVEALAQNLTRMNPYVKLELHPVQLTKANVAQVFGTCTAVAECFDNPAAKAELTFAMRRDLPATPLVAVSGIAGYGPASAITSRRVLGNHFLVGDGVSAAMPGSGLLAPRVAVAAGHQANLILRLILGAITESEGQ